MRDMLIALAGNPNSGKTTLFNALTGARQHVGNYPGITVEKKEGVARCGDQHCRIVDLPGAYSLTAYSQEELVARAMLVDERPDAVIDVLNSGALERNLYLTVQLMELGAPVVIALNMMDEARAQGLAIDAGKLSALLDVPVAETVARTGQGVQELLDRAAAYVRQRNDAPWRPLFISYGPDLDPILQEMTARIEAKGFLADRFPARWLALKLLEGDEEAERILQADPELLQALTGLTGKAASHLQATLDTYPEAVIADYRYGFVSSLLRQGVLTRRDLPDRIRLSDQMDRVLTHRLLGPVILLLVLFSVYKITFALGEAPLGWMDALFAWLGKAAEAALPTGLLRSLVVSGVIAGVGGVLSFVPLILIIFFLIAFLEDSGYMARIAYMLDRVFRIFGLHGCSVMPFIVSGGVGGGCAVPGIMAARTLRSRKEKLATLLTAPFMTCGAKLPIFLLLAGIFFPRSQAEILFCITMTGWAAALLVARILRSTIIRGAATPFVMELPPYRLPTFKGMCIHTWERTWQYIKKAGTVILALSILLWAAMTFPAPPSDAARSPSAALSGRQAPSLVADAENLAAAERLRWSAAGRLGRSLESLTQIAGFDWRTNIALLGGVAAKEVIVSTLGTAYSLGDSDAENAPTLKQRLAGDAEWPLAKGLSLMVFVLLYSPCFPTLVVLRQEAGGWLWALFSAVFNTGLAFAAAIVVYQTGSLW